MRISWPRRPRRQSGATPFTRLVRTLTIVVAVIAGYANAPVAWAAEPVAPLGASATSSPSSGPSPSLAFGPSASVGSRTSTGTSGPGAEVRIKEHPVFSLQMPRVGQSAQERAAAATAALTRVFDDPTQPLATIEEQAGIAVVFVGRTPVVALGDDDAAAAGGDLTLHVYAAGIASRIDEVLQTERSRAAIAERVFSVSLVVFLGLMAFLLFRRVGDFAARARLWVKDHPDRIPALRLGRIEVVRPAATRSAVSIALALAHRLAQFFIAYSWLIFALSQFDATRAYTDRLAGFVLAPLSALIARIGSSLPLVVVAVVAAIALGIAVRFVGLFFGTVERGETHLTWLPRDLAGPTSVLVRAGVVVVALMLASPLITGSDDGALSRAGVIALAAVGLACTPVLACAAAGVPSVFGRRVRPGQFVEAGGRAGIVRHVKLLELVLEDELGCELRVPQLLGLWHATRVLGAAPLACIHVVVDPHERPARVEEALVAAVVDTCERARVELVSLDAEGARWRVAGIPKHGKGAAALADAVAAAIADEGIALGRVRS